IDKKYELGGGNGLRGYQTNKFEGDRRIFFNAEYHFARINIDMLRIGFVIFFDLGSAWYNKDRSIMDASFYPSVGIGFRFSLPELFPNMLSFDIGYNFGNDSSEFGKIISIRMEVPIF
ncbi:MAG: BamA/TamA family outer membrane protein, partial [Spirochaetes bacterium]|nr:BamA/TamA family outer membrane protein [Spirochaetota bacterium]